MHQDSALGRLDWHQSVTAWIERRRSLENDIAEDVIRFFANAFREVHRPEEAWFGTHGTAISLVVGGIYLAAVRSADPDKGIWLLVDEDLSPIDGVAFSRVKSTRRSKTPLVWLHSAAVSGVRSFVDRPEVWRSFGRASEKIFNAPWIAGPDVSPHKRRGKTRLSELIAGHVHGDLHLPEEVEAGSTAYQEGAVRQITVNAYERNPIARRRCIAHYGPLCFVCGFDFFRVYGEAGRGFIHVHHLRQLSEIGETYEVDPIADLRPVCANCHAIIHRRNPPYTVNEVRSMLRKLAAPPEAGPCE